MPDCQFVTFNGKDLLQNVALQGMERKSQLSQFFYTNSIDTKARELKYVEFPKFYTWDTKVKSWKPREKGDAIGRIFCVHPSEGERWFLRLLLNNVRGPTSFESLKTVNGITHTSFRAAALSLGLLEKDSHLEDTLEEAFISQSCFSIRRLLAIILAMCQPSNPRALWDISYPHMIETPELQMVENDKIKINHVLSTMIPILLDHGISFADTFPELPQFDPSVQNISRVEKNWLLEQESSVVISELELENISKLNEKQKIAFDSIISAFETKTPASFFIDGPGGSGKTFLYRCLLAKIRSMGHIALACASSGKKP